MIMLMHVSFSCLIYKHQFFPLIYIYQINVSRTLVHASLGFIQYQVNVSRTLVHATLDFIQYQVNVSRTLVHASLGFIQY